MDLEKKISPDLTLINVGADVAALKAAVASLIEALPQAQRDAVEANIELFATAADNRNEKHAAFSVGEEATHRMHESLRKIRELVLKLPTWKSNQA